MKFDWYISWQNWTFGVWRIRESEKARKGWAWGIDIGPIELMWSKK